MHEFLKFVKRLDWTLLLAILAISLLSLMIIASATHANNGQYSFVIKQSVFLLVGLCTAGVLTYFDFHLLEKYAKIIYVVNLVLLVIVKFAGTSALGAQRWIQIGPFTLQPSEFAKLFMIICLARLLSQHPEGFHTWKSLLPVIALMGPPFVLVLI